MNKLEEIRVSLQQGAIPEEKRKGVFFKTGKDEYAEHDQFIGVPVPSIRQVAKDNRHLALESILEFLQSSVNEERLLALFIRVTNIREVTPHSNKPFMICINNILLISIIGTWWMHQLI